MVFVVMLLVCIPSVFMFHSNAFCFIMHYYYKKSEPFCFLAVFLTLLLFFLIFPVIIENIRESPRQWEFSMSAIAAVQNAHQSASFTGYLYHSVKEEVFYVYNKNHKR